MPTSTNEECRAVQVAKAFFQACTKLSDDNEDILPQEDGIEKLSVFGLFSELFPEFANDKDRPDSGKQGLMRLQFNKIGYEMYDKEQSRRVPAVRAKPGNPGYGFRRARWRDTRGAGEDSKICETIMRSLGVTNERLERIKKRVNDFRMEWDMVRRPSRPAGPGRPRAHKRSPAELAVEEPALLTLVQPSTPKKSKRGGAAVTNSQGEVAVAKVRSERLVEEPIAVPALVIDDAQPGTHGGEASQGQSFPQELDFGEENASLRALNMSLIYEREQQLVRIKHSESEVAALQEQLDKLLALAERKMPNGVEVAGAFGALARMVMSKSSNQIDIPQHYTAVLERSLDMYEMHSKKMVRNLEHSYIGHAHGSYSPTNHQHLFDEFHEEGPLCASCDDLRELFRSTGHKALFRSTGHRMTPDSFEDLAVQIADSHVMPETHVSVQSASGWQSSKSCEAAHKECSAHVMHHDKRSHDRHHEHDSQGHSDRRRDSSSFFGLDVYDDVCNDSSNYQWILDTATAF